MPPCEWENRMDYEVTEPSVVHEPSDYWSNASSHYFDLEGELKLTMLHPAITGLARATEGMRVVDFGCGEGGVAKSLAASGAEVLGVDKSLRTIELAKMRNATSRRLSFLHIVPHDYSSVLRDGPFDLAILSLVLVTQRYETDGQKIFEALGQSINQGGRLIVAESHPCFRHKIFSTFSTSMDVDRNYRGHALPFNVEIRDGYHPERKVRFTDFHLPLAAICKLMFDAGFHIQGLAEIYDEVEAMNLHPTTRSRVDDRVPAFILFEGIKV